MSEEASSKIEISKMSCEKKSTAKLVFLSSTRRIILWIVVLAVLVNCVGMLFPALSSTFTPYYGSIAKNIVTTHNWSDLVLIGQDWLDKPHFPFWATAVSYKLFGINAFSYILPGFIFHLIGLIYTYKIAKYWFNKDIALVASLMYVTCLHLMQSAIDVRAEAYLLGEILPACYYWLRYDRHSRAKYLILGAMFTALAMMTKGVFVLITIISGIAVLWALRGELRNFIRIKWLGALGLSMLFVLPELIALHYQFDLHPEKVVFGQQHISAMRWFFWDSQFGRFFNTGPIISSNPPTFHYLYFVHTFLWAFLPWWPVFFIALWNISNAGLAKRKLPENYVYLFATFFVTFILFSITKFQVDHYTNIIFPFACIISASWIINLYTEKKEQITFSCYAAYITELIVASILLFASIAIAMCLLHGIAQIILYILVAIVGGLIFMLRHKGVLVKSLIYPSFAIQVIFIGVMLVNGVEYIKYDAGYQIAQYINQNQVVKNAAKDFPPTVFAYNVDLKSLNLNLNPKSRYYYVESLAQIPLQTPSLYVVTSLAKKSEVMQYFADGVVVASFEGTSIGEYITMELSRAISLNKAQHKMPILDAYIVLKVR